MAVDHHRDVVRVDTRKLEGEDAALTGRHTDDAQRIDIPQPLRRISGEISFVAGDRLAADAVHIIKRVAKADRLHDRRGSRLEAMRRLVIGDVFLGDVEDHLAAALEGPHLGEPLLLAVENANARWAIKLVTGHDVPVAIDILHVDRHMHRTLRAIDQDGNAALMRDAADVLHRNNGSERIRHMGDGDELGPLRQALLEILDMERALVVDGHPDELGTLPLADEVPGDDVGVMLHDRDDNLVALAKLRHAPAVGDRVDRFRRVLGKDDIVHRRSIQEAAHLFASRFIGFRGSIGQEVQAAMHIRIFAGIGMRNGIDDDLRLLRGCAVVEIDQRLAVHHFRQDREIPANGFDIIGRCRHDLVHELCLQSGVLFQPGGDNAFQRLDQGFVFQFLDDLGYEGIDQHGAGLVPRNAASHQIVEMVRVDIGNRCAMAALNVVGEDLKLRLDRELGIVGHQQRVAGHARIRLLRIGRNTDHALEDTTGTVEHHVADDLGRTGVRNVMTEHQRHIRMRIATQQIDAANLQIGALAAHLHMQFLAHQLATGVDDEEFQLRVRTEIDADLAEMRILGSLLLQDDPDDFCTLADLDLAHRRDECGSTFDSLMTLDDRRLDISSEGHRKTAVNLPACMDELHFERRVEFCAIRKIDSIAIAHEAGIDAPDSVILAERFQPGGSRAIDQAVGITSDRQVLDGSLLACLSLKNGENGRAFDRRRQSLYQALADVARHQPQQVLEIGIVPCLDPARRQAGGLQLVQQAIADGENFAIARQIAHLVVIRLDQRRLRGGQAVRRLNVHRRVLSAPIRLQLQ
ncbi:hypothetical protein RHSP_61761 [Rhizobium freirei PRF 81]|uniref:Uncharacterized protein n=1 Tax=Rhizobium freirei PRF 81 TaxID=363754 RepID=N6VDK8_9HYPH|nr:hypothetical protein RHSP_61761 [Rhizobium freirei PRF 81]